jgi:two-component system, NarL family, response regulator
MSTSSDIKVMIVDDHPLVRAGLSAVINQERDMHIVAEADSAPWVLDCFRRHHPDVVLMDLRLGGDDGARVIQSIRAEFPDARALVISSSDDEVDVHVALAAGAMGYLCKSVVEDELIDAIRDVHAGRRHLPMWVTE